MSTPSAICLARLQEERRCWRNCYPFGFYMRPTKNADGTLNMMVWEAGVPGKKDTPWEGGVYKLRVLFPEDYPTKPPKLVFAPPLYHPNVYPSGSVCLSILNENEDWKPSITFKQILLGVQDLLNDPNLNSPAQSEAYNTLRTNPAKYLAEVRKIAQQNRP